MGLLQSTGVRLIGKEGNCCTSIKCESHGSQKWQLLRVYETCTRSKYMQNAAIIFLNQQIL